MKRLLFILLALVLAVTPAFASSTTALVKSRGEIPVQGYAPDPARCQVPATVNAAATASVTVTGWLVISFRSTADVQVFFDDASTKYMTFNGAERHTLVLNENVTAVKFTNAGASALTLEVWGM
jgi:uncharacterized protein YdeI (BOF family)